MPPAHDNVRRHFLAWDAPLLRQAVNWLAKGWDETSPLDLSRLLVVVPTKQSGRRLREALAAHAADKGQATFAPKVVSPEVLITRNLPARTASRLESLLAWAEVFRDVDLETVRDVFPIDPPARTFAWSWRLAQEFSRLQATLAEGGLRLGDVAQRLGADFPELARWTQIGALEQQHADKLAALGKRDAQAAKIELATAPAIPDDVDRIVLLATPDPLPLAITALSAFAEKLPVDVVVFASEREASAFDPWGRPIASGWEKRVLALPEFESQVYLCADPATQASAMTSVVMRYGNRLESVALGVADAAVLAPLDNELRRADRTPFDPAGSPYRNEALYQLLSALASLAREPSFETVATVARCPDFIAHLATRQPGFSAARWLAGLDELRGEHLVADLDAACDFAVKATVVARDGDDSGEQKLGAVVRRYPEVATGLAALREVRALLLGGDFAASASSVLQQLFAGRRLEFARDEDMRVEEAAAEWTELLRECRAAAKTFSGIATAEWWELALRLFGDTVRTEEKTAGALELQGWLELLWEDAPHLLVAGLNDGIVPDAVVGDAFLPESLREKLGLKTNAARFARDAYLLSALSAARESAGRLDLFFGKTSAIGDPLRPSRLLLRCADEELPKRIEFLFRAPAAPEAGVAWERAWKLRIPQEAPPDRVSVTGLGAYLKCPFRFYLGRVLGMEPVDPQKSELDALDFGTLCHAALEKFGDAALRDCTDPAVLREAVFGEFERRVREKYGRALALPLVIQLESARQRLAKAAEIQAKERADGWVMVAVEKKFELEIGGVRVTGKIDRIDRHELTGAVRVLDYKTSDTRKAPEDVHFASLRPGDTPPEWAIFDLGRRPRVWVDLQLPMYVEAVKAAQLAAPLAEAGSAGARADATPAVFGYFNLPKAAGEAGIALWTDYTRELHASAQACVEQACRAIHAGEFWPPKENLDEERDEFASLFHHGVADSVVGEDPR